MAGVSANWQMKSGMEGLYSDHINISLFFVYKGTNLSEK